MKKYFSIQKERNILKSFHILLKLKSFPKLTKWCSRYHIVLHIIVVTQFQRNIDSSSWKFLVLFAEKRWTRIRDIIERRRANFNLQGGLCSPGHIRRNERQCLSKQSFHLLTYVFIHYEAKYYAYWLRRLPSIQQLL